MAELTISQLIKIIIGAIVVVVVIVGLGIFFKSKVLSFFENLPGGTKATAGIIFGLIK